MARTEPSLLQNEQTAGGIASSRRYGAVDVVRGLAILAMIIFHFSWDLSYFGWSDIRITADPFWVWFARSIAGTILLVVGVSFAIAWQRGLRLKSYLWRMGTVAVCAGLISLGTYQLDPGSFIYFGILHHIALASLLLPMAARLPGVVLLLLGGFFLTGQYWLFSPALQAPWLSWLGLWWPVGRPSDFVPLFPWFGLPLLGLLLGRQLLARPVVLQLDSNHFFCRLCKLAGRHSLLIYMLHQPVMFGGMYLFTSWIRG